MTSLLRILITGFGAFPGAPFNPTPALVTRLTRLRRPAFSDVELRGHIFPVTYQAVDRQLPELLAQYRPHALLMFGLAARTPYVRIETRARNAITTLWPDAGGAYVRSGAIVRGAEAMQVGPHTPRLMRAARATGIDARLSRDAGRYQRLGAGGRSAMMAARLQGDISGSAPCRAACGGERVDFGMRAAGELMPAAA